MSQSQNPHSPHRRHVQRPKGAQDPKQTAEEGTTFFKPNVFEGALTQEGILFLVHFQPYGLWCTAAVAPTTAD